MADRSRNSGHKDPKNALSETIGQRAEYKRRADRQEKRSAWFGLGMFGLVGWSVAIPTVLGVALGLWLDGRWPGGPSWTLTFLLLGIALGCLNAWYWIRQESRRD